MGGENGKGRDEGETAHLPLAWGSGPGEEEGGEDGEGKRGGEVYVTHEEACARGKVPKEGGKVSSERAQ